MSDEALIEAMARAIGREDGIPDDLWSASIPHATAALAEIRKTHAVVPREITEPMRYAIWSAQYLHHGASAFEAAELAIRSMETEGQADQDRFAYRAMLTASESTNVR